MEERGGRILRLISPLIFIPLVKMRRNTKTSHQPEEVQDVSTGEPSSAKYEKSKEKRMVPSKRVSFAITCITALCMQFHYLGQSYEPSPTLQLQRARLGDGESNLTQVKFPKAALALILIISSVFLGCYHVLIDVGSNIGMHARFLFEPEKFPESKSSVPKLNEEFGMKRDNRDFCVFSFGKLF